jgi:hypothetical protein
VSVTRTFLAWYRTGLATAVAGVPPAGSARADLPAELTVTGDTARTGHVPVQLAGPGDVVGLDPAEIRRCEPYDGCADFEPGYLAYVELASPDLPWRFSPVGPAARPLPDPEDPAAAPATQHRLTPWLALVVVPDGQASVAPAAAGRLPVLTCPVAELPDPAEIWAWAHVQVSTADGGDPVAAAGDPSRSVARLVCPRRLEPGIAYRAFVVPAFAAGVTAAGVTFAGPDPLQPAWAATGQVSLPVYYSYAFTTGQAGTFETLARRLRPRPAPAATAGRTIAIDAPGWGVVGTAGATVLVQGALRPLPGAGHPPELPSDAGYAAQLAAAISVQGTGLQLRPPVYGQDYAGGATVVQAAVPGWLTALNTDPRRRLAAGLGAWTVAVMQDELADRAWRQLATAGLVPPAAADPDLAGVLHDALAVRTAETPAAALPATLARLSRAGGPFARNGTATLRTATLRTAPVPAAPPAEPAGRTRFAPAFDDPACAYLAAVSPEWLLPGAGDVPEDAIVVMATNPAFTEAYLIGLNHALARELAWRRFPLDPTVLMFRRFWASAPGAPDAAVAPVSQWGVGSALGDHSPAADQLVLLIRGALLRRFPTAAVYLSGRQADGTERHLLPSLAATLGAGTAFFGFPITPDEALDPAPDSGVSAWSVVLQESADHVRYGLDDAPGDGSTATVRGWQDLDWANPHVAGHASLPVAGPLAGVSRPLTAAAPGTVPQAVWGADSGQLAAALTRPAFRVRIPVVLWMAPPAAAGPQP